MNESLDVKIPKRTKWLFSLSGIGRDMAYTLVNYFIIYFLTNGLGLLDWELAAVTVITVIARFWDAANDPMMGTIVDNTRSRWGKFKPWILIGAVLNAVVMFLFFQDFGIRGVPFLAVFAVIYLLWGMTYTMNDISYWSMLPSFSADPKEREGTGSLARVFASLGMFLVIAVTPMLYGAIGTNQTFRLLAVIVPIIFVACQLMLVFGVKENKSLITSVQSKTGFKEMFKLIIKNDQLVVMVLSILTFNVGYYLTTSFGPYFFDFTFGDYGGMSFTVFAGVLAVSQITALAAYPLFAKHFNRKQLFTLAIAAVTVGYVGFFAASFFHSMLSLGIAGLFMFAGQAFIQVLVLVMLADTIEYGQWKTGKRTESIFFALQPFVNKMASSIQVGLLSLTLIVSGLNGISYQITQMKDSTNEEIRQFISTAVTPEMNMFLRFAMILIPMLLIFASYLIFMTKFKIDGKMYKGIIEDLKARELAKAKDVE